MRIDWLCLSAFTASLIALRIGALEPAEAPGPDALPHPVAVEPDDLLGNNESSPRTDGATQDIVTARQRLDRANARYSTMMARRYPRGDARAAIVAERNAAEAHLLELLRASPSTGGTVPQPTSQW